MLFVNINLWADRFYGKYFGLIENYREEFPDMVIFKSPSKLIPNKYLNMTNQLKFEQMLKDPLYCEQHKNVYLFDNE